MIVSKKDFLKTCGNVVYTVQLFSNNFETIQYMFFMGKWNTPFFQESNGNIYTTKGYKGYYFPVDENGKIHDGYTVNGEKVYIINPKTKKTAYAHWRTDKFTLKKSYESFSVTKY